ncbi:MAG: hypothetical protein KA748_14180 [Halomonas sp.]|nr:hypothetical protein [Halomonas sp.]MBP5981340.1 hypothetical protein [Halomonas sp.]
MRSLSASKPTYSAELEDEVTTIEIGTYDVLLPCRRYRVTFKVAEVGKVSLTTEFLLRLIHAVDGMPESEVAKFFGFNSQEMAFLLNDAVSLGYVIREAGRLWLTTAGRQLFVQGEDAPQIYDVETKTVIQGFDMLSFSPEEKTWLEHFNFDSRLPELPIDATLASKARDRIPASFKRHFSTLMYKRDSRYAPRKSLYSIDNVTSSDRFTSIVPVVVKAIPSHPSLGEPDLLVWRSEEQLDRLSQITSAVAQFVHELRMDKPADAAEHYQILADLAPEFMKDYTSGSGVAVERFYRDVVALKGGGFRSNRRTVPILGPLLCAKNLKLLFDGIERTGANSPVHCLPKKYYWRAPQNRHWGMSRKLPHICSQIAEYLATKAGDDSPSPRSVLIQEGRCWGLDRAFSEVQDAPLGSIPSSVEIILIPGLAVAVLVHLPILATSGHAVPLGFISVDSQVVARAVALLRESVPIEVPTEYITEDMIDLPSE